MYGKPKVGQKIWAVREYPYGGRRWGREEPRYMTVTKVGRLYFYIQLSTWNILKVSLAEWKEMTEFRGNGFWRFYPKQCVWEEIILKKSLVSLLKGEFHIKNHKNFSLEQLQTITKILGLKLPKEVKT